MDHPVLKVSGLGISFRNEQKWNQVTKEISFEVLPNEILGIVGESGSGKSVSSLAVMGLLPSKNSRIDSRSVVFKENDITRLPEKQFQNIRGKELTMIFQEPMSSLNPSMTCGKQVAEVLERHTTL